jgi:hypothetical protein
MLLAVFMTPQGNRRIACPPTGQVGNGVDNHKRGTSGALAARSTPVTDKQLTIPTQIRAGGLQGSQQGRKFPKGTWW